MPFIEPDFVTDPAAIETVGLDYLRSAIPGWEPADGGPMTMLIRAHARMIAEERDQAATVYPGIFRYLLAKIHRVQPLGASAATVAATFTMRDTAGYTIPAGLEVFVRTAGDDGVLFLVQTDVTIAPGAAATAAGEVTLRAAAGYEGTIGNGLGSGHDAVVLRAEQQYQSVALVGVSDGGVDAEEDDDFLDRSAEELTVTSPVPILEPDFALLARRHPLVGRALAINLYDPVTRTSDNERMVTVVVAGPAGERLSSTVRGEVQAELEGLRELNWRAPVIDPTYTAVDAVFELILWPGEDRTTVLAAAVAASQAYLSPAQWGARPGVGEQPGWEDDETIVYWSEVNAMLNQVAGVKRVSRLEIGLEGRTLGTSNVTLAGPGALPLPGAGIRGTVIGG